MDIKIRRAIPGDERILAQLVMAVQTLHVKHQPTRFKPIDSNDPDLIRLYALQLVKDDAHIFIAEADGDPVGYLSSIFHETPENPFVYAKRVMHIDQISVNESHQGQGIGQLLMEQVLQVAHDLEVEMVTLGVAGFNDIAIRFYEKLGFTFRSHAMWLSLTADDQ